MENLELTEETADLINNGIKDIPYKRVRFNDNLGTNTIFITLSFQSKKNWSYGILQNSVYCTFTIYYENNKVKIKCIDADYNLWHTVKFKKCTVKTVNDIINKINDYINNVNLVIDKLKPIC